MASAGAAGGSEEEEAQDVLARLAERGEEFERGALARAYAIAEPVETADPEYAEGLRQAISAALQYGLAALRHGTDDPPPVPQVLLSQARLAARNGVSLDTVLRRYFSGFALFGDFVIGEAEESPLPEGASVQELLAKEASHFDRLIEAVSQEHTRERQRRFRSPRQRQAERVRRLLAGESAEAEKLDYELEAWHIAAIGSGRDAEAALRCLAGVLDRRLLLIRPGGEAVWAWLGGHSQMPTEAIVERVDGRWPSEALLSLGEPAQGIEGWRFSHRQAKAALPIAQRQGQGIVPYAEVSLLASAIQDEVLVESLRRVYLEPLESARDGGTMRETLRAYFDAERNVSSAAAVLGVHRETVANRLRMVEARTGRKLASAAADIDLALRVEELAADTLTS